MIFLLLFPQKGILFADRGIKAFLVYMDRKVKKVISLLQGLKVSFIHNVLHFVLHNTDTLNLFA